MLDGSEPAGDGGARVVQPSAPGEGVRELAAEDLAELEERPHTDADVEFLHGMIPHHAQALEMTSLVADRTDNEDVTLLARRIEVSQESEIELMEDWLEARDEPAAGPHMEHGHGGHGLMPGMLSDGQMARLAAAQGSEFNRLFCRLMIQHHRGALVMVAELREAGGGLDPEVYRLSSDIEADQEIEIRRMEEMLAGTFGEGL